MDNEFLTNIAKIKNATTARRIIWDKTANTAFFWTAKDTPEQKINVVIQEVGGKNNDKVIFRIWDVTRRKALYEISTDTTDEVLRGALFDLYNFVQTNYSMGDSGILNDLLKDL